MQQNKFPLILRCGHVLETIDDLINFALQNPNRIKGESRAISIWIKSFGYNDEERLEIEKKVQFAALGVRPHEISRDMLDDITAVPKHRYTILQSDSPPQMAKMGDRWFNPIDQSEMVYVPAGKFLRGNHQKILMEVLPRLGVPQDKINIFFDESPEELIYLDGFWIDRYAITNRQYALFLEETGALHECKNEAERYRCSRIIKHGNHKGAEFPIHNITWFEAERYCRWAGKTLPTEAQWEKAARGGVDNRMFPWGNQLDFQRMNTIETSLPFPDGVVVNQNELNVSLYACIQMSGNVGEWCLDDYDAEFYSASLHNNPICLRGKRSEYDKVIRGGSTVRPVAYARCSSRDYGSPGKELEFVGFRAVCLI